MAAKQFENTILGDTIYRAEGISRPYLTHSRCCFYEKTWIGARTVSIIENITWSMGTGSPTLISDNKLSTGFLLVVHSQLPMASNLFFIIRLEGLSSPLTFLKATPDAVAFVGRCGF